MKKLMVMMAAAAMVGAANAEASYSYNAKVYAYTDKDATPSADHASWYNYYGLTQATAQDLLDATKTVTYSDVAKWLGQNFAVNSEEVKTEAQSLITFWRFKESMSQYQFTDTSLGSFMSTDDFIGVVLFDNGTDQAYNVLSADGSNSYFTFNDQKGASSSTGWIAVPEPTSGLLMLLGMAGLALKRRRA